MYEVGQATYAHYELDGLPKDPAGFLSPVQDRYIPSALKTLNLSMTAVSCTIGMPVSRHAQAQH